MSDFVLHCQACGRLDMDPVPHTGPLSCDGCGSVHVLRKDRMDVLQSVGIAVFKALACAWMGGHFAAYLGAPAALATVCGVVVFGAAVHLLRWK